MLRVLVVDDEPLARDELAFLLGEMKEVEVVGQVGSGAEALRLVAELQPDVVFLDVQMPELDGFAVASRLAPLEAPPAVVFATAYDEYALHAFEVEAVDYLLKPIQPARLHRTVERLRRDRSASPTADVLHRLEAILGGRRPGRERSLPVKRDGRVLLVPPAEIVYAVSLDHGSRLAVGRSAFDTGYTLKDLEERLGGTRFLRVHKRYLVNLDRVREFIPWPGGTASLVMADEERTHIPVSRLQLRAVREALGIDS